MSMKNYTKITAHSVKDQFSKIIRSYIGPKGLISYKQAARELEVEERTLGSWVRGEKQITLSSLLKLSLYLPTSFIKQVINIGRSE
jgi:plasmid maintenance system antidote protein VapI